MNSPAEIKKPCRSKWQQKHLRLDCYSPRTQELADEAENFCGRWYRNQTTDSLLVLAGESNCGKSHTARAIGQFCRFFSVKAFEGGAWDRCGRLPMVASVTWPETTDQFKSGDYSILHDLLDCDLVIIDDIGAENDPSKNAADKLCQVLSRREKKFTVVTTNIPPDQWPEKFDTRIADRLMRNSKVVDLFGLPSYAMRPAFRSFAAMSCPAD
jgi:chromosomal replication initiation ATPase DnaA